MRFSAINLLLAATAGLASASEAEADANLLDYVLFREQMLYWGYNWEPIKVKTDDGFNLTTFHILGRIGHHYEPDPNLNPIVMMNGLECDATTWFGMGDKNDVPLPLRLHNNGFDIYLAANRGTKYCQEHDKFTID